MSTILTLAQKDLRLLLRNRGARFFVFAWPIITSVLFGIVFGGGGGDSAKPRVALSDLDGTPAAHEFVAQLKAIKELDVDEQPADAARDLVRSSKRVAAVIVPAGYGTAAQRMFYGEPPTVELAIDPSRRAEQAMVEGMLHRIAGQGMSKRLTDSRASAAWLKQARGDLDGLPAEQRASMTQFFDSLEHFLASKPAPAPAAAGGGDNQESGWQPLAVKTQSVARQRSGPANAFGITFPQGMLWGIVGCMMSFAAALVLERMQGTLVRLQASPMSSTQILLGKGLACVIAIVGLVGGLTLVAMLGFSVRPNSFSLLALAAASAAVAFTGIMMLIASLGTTVQTVSGAGWAIMMPLMLFGGGMIPLFAMPAWMQSLGSISPVKWAILAIEGAVWRGFTLADMLLPVAILLGVGVLSFGIGAKRFAMRVA